MKPRLSNLLCVAAAVAASSFPSFAQETDRPGGQPGMLPGLERLRPDERQKVIAARDKAAQDPSVQAAMTEQETARQDRKKLFRKLMLEADPSLAEVLPEKPERPEQGDGAGFAGARPEGVRGRNSDQQRLNQLLQPVRLDNLPPEIRPKVEKAFDKISNKRELEAAELRLKDASKAFRDAQDEAMIKADPSVRTLLAKMRAPQNGAGHGRRW
jgi:hypothetical protein